MSVRDLRGPAFASKRNLGSVPAAGPWVRPSSWLALPDVTGLQKFAGLHAVYPDSNFVALSAEGNFTVDWGDGTGTTNVSSGVTAEYNIPYANAATTSDVGIAGAVACTFTDSGDTVNLTAHGWINGQQVAFSTITSTTGISTYTTYFIVNKAADTFQVATTAGGSALTLTTNGSGNVYVPQYRQVIVTVVPNGGNITKLNLHIKHSTSGLQKYSSGFLDVAISAANMTDLRFAVQTPGLLGQVITHSLLQQFNLVASDLRQLGNLIYLCYSLRNIQNVVTSSAAAVSASCTFTDSTDTVGLTAHGFRDGDSVIFTTVTTTTGITKNTEYFARDVATDTFKVTNTYGGTAMVLTTDGTGTAVRGTNFSNMFYNCSSLTSVPLFNTAAGMDFGNMFQYCYALPSVPLLVTSGGSTVYTNMFSTCQSLKSAALSGTANTISYVNCELSAAELNKIYTGLATATKTITVTGNWGVASDDTSIATGTNWTVTG